MKLILSLVCAIQVLSLPAQSISELYQQVRGSVVVIQTTEKVLSSGAGERRMVAEFGLSSGVLISSDAIVTAAHVVQTAENLKVIFPSGEEVPAKVISSSPDADVALLRLIWQPKDQVVAKMGDSDLVKIGDQVFVIGAPYGLDHSLSVGYISARRKDETISSGYTQTEYFQTDAAINHGNSGGPMFNMNGEVIGIASFILSESGGFQGLGFAATSNVARSLLLERKGFWSGLDGYVLSGAMAKIFNLPQNSGVLVQRVVLLSPAGAMGIEGGKYQAKIEDEELIVGGDIILSVNGISVGKNSAEKIQESLRAARSGDPFKVKVLRAGKILELEGKIP